MKTSEKELKQTIKQAYEAATPDVLASVLSCCEKEKGRVIPMEKKSRSRRSRFIGFVAAAAALLMVLAGTVGVLAGSARRNGEVFATVSLDVNPSIEIAVNKQEKVISVKALNDDAARIVNNMELVGSGIDVAVNALIGSMLRNGYLSDIANSILITVDNADAQMAQQLQRKLADEIEAALAASGGGAVISQTADTREDMESIANRYGITKGKAQLIYSIIAAAPKFTFEQLAGLSINELNLLYNKYGRVNPADGRINEGQPSENAYIGDERAIEIALDHAGVSAEEVTSAIILTVAILRCEQLEDVLGIENYNRCIICAVVLNLLDRLEDSVSECDRCAVVISSTDAGCGEDSIDDRCILDLADLVDERVLNLGSEERLVVEDLVCLLDISSDLCECECLALERCGVLRLLSTLSCCCRCALISSLQEVCDSVAADLSVAEEVSDCCSSGKRSDASVNICDLYGCDYISSRLKMNGNACLLVCHLGSRLCEELEIGHLNIAIVLISLDSAHSSDSLLSLLSLCDLLFNLSDLLDECLALCECLVCYFS